MREENRALIECLDCEKIILERVEACSFFGYLKALFESGVGKEEIPERENPRKVQISQGHDRDKQGSIETGYGQLSSSVEVLAEFIY